MKTHICRGSGFSMLELMIVVALISVLAALAAPAFMRTRETAIATNCQNSLRQISSACDRYMLEHTNAVPQLSDLSPEFVRSIPPCRGGGTYTILPTGEATCSLAANGHEL